MSKKNKDRFWIRVTCAYILLAPILFLAVNDVSKAASISTCVNQIKWKTDRYERDLQICDEGSERYCDWAKNSLQLLNSQIERCKDG